MKFFSLVNRNLYLFKNYSNYSSEYAGVDFIQLSSGSERKGYKVVGVMQEFDKIFVSLV